MGSGSYLLEVKGYVDELMVFSNSTWLRFSPKGFSTFIQTDKLNYLPGQTVKIRVVSIQPDWKPLESWVDIAIKVSLKLSKHTPTAPSKCIQKNPQSDCIKYRFKQRPTKNYHKGVINVHRRVILLNLGIDLEVSSILWTQLLVFSPHATQNILRSSHFLPQIPDIQTKRTKTEKKIPGKQQIKQSCH